MQVTGIQQSLVEKWFDRHRGSSIVAIVIGRNEGERLKRCLESLDRLDTAIVYVDSGSTDGSTAHAEASGALVVPLDSRIPFTAARARNAGVRAAQALGVTPKYFQFVDGDCTVRDGWLNHAVAFLDSNKGFAAVCGRRREIAPSASIYNWLCDREWNTQVGECPSFGGDVLISSDEFNRARGYRDDLICGEEPELCIRLREKGLKIYRIGQEMTYHDANIMHFRQWWKRAIRSGYGTARVVHLHWRSAYVVWRRDLARSLFYGLALPALSLLGAVLSAWFLLLLALYPIHLLRVYLRASESGWRSWAYAGLMTAAKFAESWGAIRYAWDCVTGRMSRIIEYKN